MYFQGPLLALNFYQLMELFPFLVLALSFGLAIIGAGLKFSTKYFKLLGFIGFGTAILLWIFTLLDPSETFLGLRGSSITRIVGILVCGFGIISFAGFDAADRYRQKPVWLALTFLSVLGFTLLPTSKNWVSFFVFLESFSIPAYVLVAFDSKRERSLEASLKYMLAGAFASALLLMGIALAYLTSGSLHYLGLASNFPQGALSTIALLLILAGVLFKLTAVPFHFWAADVYQGAPIGVASFLAAATKISVFTAAALAFHECAFSLRADFVMASVLVAIASALVGSFLAFTQRSFRRMMAYSGTVNAGILVPLMVTGAAGISSGLFFLMVYGATLMIMMSSFGALMKKRGIDPNEDLDINGFGQDDTKLASFETLVIVVGLISLAGIPPFPGFVAKYWAYSDLWSLGHRSVVICALLATLMGVAYYIRLAGKFYFTESRKT